MLSIGTHVDDELGAASDVRDKNGTRDRFVANTSIKIDRLQSALSRVEGELEEVRAALAELQDIKDQQRRITAASQGEARVRAQKLDELVRSVREHKTRLDRIENPGTAGDYHHFNTFEAVSRQLAQVTALRTEFAKVIRNTRIDAWLFCATWALLCVTLFKLLA